MAGKGGWVREGDVPPPAREVFFTGGRYLMHEKVFSLGQVMLGYKYAQ